MSGVFTFQASGDEDQWVFEKALCDVVGGLLTRFYPGRSWHVRANGSVVDILCHTVNTEKGYRLFADKYPTPDTMSRAVMLAGGEILERNGLSRVVAASDDEWGAPRDVRGNIMAADS